jgi:hypothetical protein
MLKEAKSIEWPIKTQYLHVQVDPATGAITGTMLTDVIFLHA